MKAIVLKDPGFDSIWKKGKKPHKKGNLNVVQI